MWFLAVDDMKKYSYTLFTFAASMVLLFTSCSNDDISGADKGLSVPVQFNAEKVSKPRVRTVKDKDGTTHWKQNDAIGVFMLGHDEKLAASTIAQSADNIEYKVRAEEKNLTAGDVDQTIYYPTINLGDKFDFVAYYPYLSSLYEYSYPLDVSDQSDESKIDVLYVKVNNEGKGYDNKSEAVPLSFTHVLSRLNFTISAGVGYQDADLLGLTVRIHGMATTVKLDLTEGTIDTESLGHVAVLTLNSAADGKLASGIVIPQPTSAMLEIELVDGTVFRWYFPVENFEAGKQYSYEVEVSD